MTSTRRLHPLPERWAEPILTLVHITRAAALPPNVDPTPWAAAEAGQYALRTGHKAARRTASAGQYAAHALRLYAAEAIAHGEAASWAHELVCERAALTTWDASVRAAAAHRLLVAAGQDFPAGDPVPALLVADWLLSGTTGPAIIETTGRLAAYVLALPGVDVDHLGGAWHATHGHRLEQQGRGAA